MQQKLQQIDDFGGDGIAHTTSFSRERGTALGTKRWINKIRNAIGMLKSFFSKLPYLRKTTFLNMCFFYFFIFTDYYLFCELFLTHNNKSQSRHRRRATKRCDLCGTTRTAISWKSTGNLQLCDNCYVSVEQSRAKQSRQKKKGRTCGKGQAKAKTKTKTKTMQNKRKHDRSKLCKPKKQNKPNQVHVRHTNARNVRSDGKKPKLRTNRTMETSISPRLTVSAAARKSPSKKPKSSTRLFKGEPTRLQTSASHKKQNGCHGVHRAPLYDQEEIVEILAAKWNNKIVAKIGPDIPNKPLSKITSSFKSLFCERRITNRNTQTSTKKNEHALCSTHGSAERRARKGKNPQRLEKQDATVNYISPPLVVGRRNFHDSNHSEILLRNVVLRAPSQQLSSCNTLDTWVSGQQLSTFLSHHGFAYQNSEETAELNK